MEENIRSKFNESVHELKNLINHIVSDDELKNAVQDVRGKIARQVQEQPIATVAAAVAVGFILGKIIRR